MCCVASSSSFNPSVPVNRPGATRDQWLALRRAFLPRAEQILPYLREIDENQWYSNFGPLNQRFEARLAEHFGVSAGGVLTVSSATAGLQIALARANPARPRPEAACAIPAFSFPAAAAVATTAGFTPVFADVGDDSWSLTPGAVASLGPNTDVAAALPVSFFGVPPDIAGWENFARETGAAVVVDAAWCFDSLVPGTVPSVVSLHATKVFGIGEGGVIVCTDPDTIEQLRAMANFGMGRDRVAQFAQGGNAKMSEYAAAVGLAALDSWPGRCVKLRALASRYAARLDGIPDCRVMPGIDGTWTPATIAVRLPGAAIEPALAAFAERKIEVRQWWTPALPEHPAFRQIGTPVPLTNSARLAREVLHLPFHEAVTEQDVDRISDILGGVLGV
jgi:dTDP-4-amino-4,6-dideoxygalactose transaminase